MAANPGGAFQDITSGNSATSRDNGFPATKGWVPVTGWGAAAARSRMVNEVCLDSGI